MLSASSPVVYPASSSPPAAKRGKSHDGARPKARGKAGFLVDSDSEEDVDDDLGRPAAKRRMLSSPRVDVGVDTQPSSPPEIHAEIQVTKTQTFEARISPEPDQAAGQAGNTYKDASVDALFNAGGNLGSTFQKLSSKRSSAYKITTCSGKTLDIAKRTAQVTETYEHLVASRSKTKEGRAKRAYYGINIHELVDAAKEEIINAKSARDQTTHEAPLPSVESPGVTKRSKSSILWTEKYRARKYIDLCGDDSTNRQVLRWLKRWDPIVFPGAERSRLVAKRQAMKAQIEDEKPHRKILMLTGPPGLGKTTLAHVCARQAGYEVLEINASDDRSRDVVNNQIRTTLGTETVKTVQHRKLSADQEQKIARPVCVVVDEVDGVVSGSSGSGEGGFVKALMDLITIGEKNTSGQNTTEQQPGRKKKKGDDFRQMRPLVLICNDVYHPSLRPLRLSNLAEVIHVGKPTIDAVVTRLKTVFEREGIPCEKDAARKLCEAAWGVSSGLDARKGAEGSAEGDLRGAMVVGEWVARRLRSSSLKETLGLTRQWVEQNVVQSLAHGGGGARGIGRGNVKDIVTRIFQEGAGFPKGKVNVAPTAVPKGEQPQAQLGFSEQAKKYAMERLRQMVETSGDVDRVITDIFAEYPTHDFNDDSFLTKPDQAYEWMHFHDTCSSRIFGGQDWELAPYLSQPVLACHHLFATPVKHSQLMYQRRGVKEEEEEVPLPFSGPRAAFAAHEAEKENRGMLQFIQTQLTPTLMRSFRSAEDIATDFLPYLIRLVSPNVKPVVVGGSGDQWGTASVRKESEKLMVKRAADALLDVGINLQRGKIEGEAFSRPTYVYRMEPDLDALTTFETSAAVIHGTQAPVRYAVRQVLDQEMQRVTVLRDTHARQARFRAGNPHSQDVFVFDDKENTPKAKDPMLPAIPIKRDFFGRIVKQPEPNPLSETDGNGEKRAKKSGDESLGKGAKVWVTFHEGMNNAVRKPISLDELLTGL